MSLFSLVTSFQLRGKGKRERQRIINIHSMVKCVQLVGRLRDRATALFGGKVRIRIVVARIPRRNQRPGNLWPSMRSCVLVASPGQKLVMMKMKSAGWIKQFLVTKRKKTSTSWIWSCSTLLCLVVASGSMVAEALSSDPSLPPPQVWPLT